MNAGNAPHSETLARFRDRFPSLSDSVHLASCSQGALSTDLSSAMLEMLHTMRQFGAPWDRWTAEVEQARATFAAYINAHPEEIAIVSCASEAAYHVASSRRWDPRPNIITTDMEFPSIAHVWLAQQPRGANVVYARHHDGVVAAEDYCEIIDERTGLVSIPLTSYRNGARMPVAEAVAAAQATGAKVFIDAYQACGVEPVDVRELECDYLATGVLKYMLGLPGLAFLYVRGGTVDEVTPQLTGWFGQSDPFQFDTRNLDFAPDARRFQTGTPAVPAAYAANAGLRALATIPQDVVRARVSELTGLAHQTLTDDGERLWSPDDPDLRGPMVTLIDDDPDQLAHYLASQRISTSPRGHVIRLSFHGYNNESDVNAVCEAIRDYRKGPRS